MLYFHKELKEKLKSDYQIQKAVLNKEYYKIENGLYSDIELVSPLEIICKKYPDATTRSASRIKDNNIKQIFIPNDLFEFGKTQITIENIKINIYDEERILVDLIRKKNTIPFDYYKEIIANYRAKADTLDIYKIQKYISLYKNELNLYDTLMREVF